MRPRGYSHVTLVRTVGATPTARSPIGRGGGRAAPRARAADASRDPSGAQRTPNARPPANKRSQQRSVTRHSSTAHGSPASRCSVAQIRILNAARQLERSPAGPTQVVHSTPRHPASRDSTSHANACRRVFSRSNRNTRRMPRCRHADGRRRTERRNKCGAQVAAARQPRCACACWGCQGGCCI